MTSTIIGYFEFKCCYWSLDRTGLRSWGSRKVLLLLDTLVSHILQKSMRVVFQNLVRNKKGHRLSYGLRKFWAFTQAFDLVSSRSIVPEPEPECRTFDAELRIRIQTQCVRKSINRLSYQETYSTITHRSTSYCGYK